MSETQSEGLFEGWVILELLGHRRLGGYLKEVSIAGASFVRLDVINDQGESVVTQFYGAGSIYCITPVVKEIAIGFGTRNQPVPVKSWELPKPVPLPPHPDDAIFPDEDTEEDDYDDDNY
jgi:hypothetical protein